MLICKTLMNLDFQMFGVGFHESFGGNCEIVVRPIARLEMRLFPLGGSSNA